MIDPRYATTVGAVPLPSGFGVPQSAPQYQYHHHHHHHHKHKGEHEESPVSRDESIHKVDHSRHHHYQQNNDLPLGTGYGLPNTAVGYGVPNAAVGYGVPHATVSYGVPNTAVGYGADASAAYYQQQQPYATAAYGYPTQYPSVPYGQVPFTSDLGNQTPKRHRRHHRHHRRHHSTEGANIAAAEQPVELVAEKLIGKRSSSVLANENQPAVLLEQAVAGEAVDGQVTHHRHHRHHRHHHQGDGPTSLGRSHHSHGHAHQHPSDVLDPELGHQYHHHHHHRHHSHGHSQSRTTTDANGYGHINKDLIFIERGDHSPHRQEPPSNYEYKGKIEVQGIDREYHTHSTTQASAVPSVQPVAPAPSAGPCPSGWQQMLLTGGSCGPCPTGGVPFFGQSVATNAATTGYGGYGVTAPYPVQCQVVGDYYGGSNVGNVSTVYPQPVSNNYVEQGQTDHVEQRVTERAKIIEVWQKKSKSKPNDDGDHGRRESPSEERSHPRGGDYSIRPDSPSEKPSIDFDRFRDQILAAIERIPRGRDTVIQTQVPVSHQPEVRRDVERIVEQAPGEVRVIVQPIQPVFYMPRQTGSTTPTPQIGPAPIIQQAAASAPHIVYVPRNVYVPVIKPVFVPRERVIVRPQVIHVARPVLVDRPVPVTQRPIIIDRERPVPVPVRAAGGQAQQSGGSKVVREEYVYRDNLPVAYGGRCAEFAGGVNYGYVPTQQQHQQQQQHFSTSSAHESASLYQGGGGGGVGVSGSFVNVNVPNQFQESHSSSYTNVQNAGGAGAGLGSAYGSYSNLADVGCVGAVNVGQTNQQVLQQTFEQSAQIAGGAVHGRTQIEILDTTVNPRWQKTDEPALVRRYGRPAFEIVHKGELVEQQMYNELARSSSAGVVRSASSGSYISGSGI